MKVLSTIISGKYDDGLTKKPNEIFVHSEERGQSFSHGTRDDD